MADDRTKPTSPWFHGTASEHPAYITPEEIQAAIDAGATQAELHEVVLRAIADRAAEDPTLCAFVVVRARRER